ncbi:receptor-like protein kinase FERONIA [Senna tora]|uniref:Receptor-like protein kinase FERONIA n=1 Tax=Senna tora TaxID=362788 RepID=A0A834TJS6_9FABA|nr:receptor-like protein kinase FERONIA [Senna tora]
MAMLVNKKEGSANSNPTTILLSCLCLLVVEHQLLSLIICVHSYQPIEDLVIFCGTSTLPLNTPNDQNRRWLADNIEEFELFSLTESSTHNSSVTATFSYLPTSLINTYLYASARLSYSQFTYSFHVTDGPKIVRLHFYPSSYPNFQRFDSLFSVKSGNFTLLKDFNASLVADYSQDEIVSKEYCIHVDPGQRLNVTFTPTNSNNNNYAFINSIEIVSMPTYLYFTDPTQHGLPLMMGAINSNDFRIDNTRAMEMEYRINVGGKAIGSEGDTGMFRSWDFDVDFLNKSASASNSDLPFDTKNPLNYSIISDYTAPEDVYRTARSYGENQKSMFNVTWNFEVVSEFDYLVRLHFCEVDPAVNKTSQRVFQIFIADALAESHADVMKWTESRMVPYYRDYAVRFNNPSLNRRINLSIKLQPHPNPNVRIYDDILLNGIEIFKLSDQLNNGNLAEPNPKLPPSPPTPKSDLSKMTIIAKSKFNQSSLPSDLCRRFSIAEIKAATNNFDDDFKVGVGGFGNVYKGYIINDGKAPVAIKRLKPGSQQGAHEFHTEIHMLSKLRHLHLVSLIGYCKQSNEMILRRLEICIGAARGLHYLHREETHTIIHRDVKSSNILLDENWVAKISDFGLCRLGPTTMSKNYVTTLVKGSVGYLDPEYYKSQHLTDKSDVYSFGVVLFEVLSGKPPLIRTVDKEQVLLADWAKNCVAKGTIGEIVDSNLKDEISWECLSKFIEIGVSCLDDDGAKRPSMNDVVCGLELALRFQETDDQHKSGFGRKDVIEEE